MSTQQAVKDLRSAATAYAQRDANKAQICYDIANKLVKYGSFASPRQEAFAQTLISGSTGAAPVAQHLANYGSVKKALDAALARGIKRPAIRIAVVGASFVFNRAPDTGKNPGQVYVKRDGAYVGKIAADGTFGKSYDCAAADVAALQTIAQDPLKAARESGKLTGSCSCCGRALSDPQSLQDGIGPICSSKYFDYQEVA